MNRVTIFLNARGEVVAQAERLAKAPSGNGDQRRKQMRNGWQPTWIPAGRPAPLTAGAVCDALPEHYSDVQLAFALGSLPEPPEIAAAREIAEDAEGRVEFERAVRDELAAIENRRFCAESGLV